MKYLDLLEAVSLFILVVALIYVLIYFVMWLIDKILILSHTTSPKLFIYITNPYLNSQRFRRLVEAIVLDYLAIEGKKLQEDFLIDACHHIVLEEELLQKMIKELEVRFRLSIPRQFFSKWLLTKVGIQKYVILLPSVSEV